MIDMGGKAYSGMNGGLRGGVGGGGVYEEVKQGQFIQEKSTPFLRIIEQ